MQSANDVDRLELDAAAEALLELARKYLRKRGLTNSEADRLASGWIADDKGKPDWSDKHLSDEGVRHALAALDGAAEARRSTTDPRSFLEGLSAGIGLVGMQVPEAASRVISAQGKLNGGKKAGKFGPLKRALIRVAGGIPALKRESVDDIVRKFLASDYIEDEPGLASRDQRDEFTWADEGGALHTHTVKSLRNQIMELKGL